MGSKNAKQHRKDKQEAKKANRAVVNPFSDFTTEADICTWVNAFKSYLDEGRAYPIHGLRAAVEEGESAKRHPRTPEQIEAMADRILEQLELRGVKQAIVMLKDGTTDHVLYTNGLKNVRCVA